MARICVDINKIKMENNSCLYEVETKDEGGASFFVRVDKVARRVDVYLNKDFIAPVLSVNTDEEREIGEIQGISRSILLHVLWRCMQTYDKKEFPHSLSFCS